MMNLTKDSVESAISEIKKDLEVFQIAPQNLDKFDLNKELDNDCLRCVNGEGGNYIKFLALLTKKFQFNNIVELGNQKGLSTLAIYDQLPAHTTFTTIDIIEDLRYCPEKMKTDQRVSILVGDVCDTNILRQIPDKIDLLFTDTVHFDFQIRDEFSIYKHLLADTALVAIDDIHANDKVKFWDELNYDKWDLTELCHSTGWGLFLYKRKEALPREERWLNAVNSSSKIWQRKYCELLKEDTLQFESTLRERMKRILKKYPGLYKNIIKLKNKLT